MEDVKKTDVKATAAKVETKAAEVKADVKATAAKVETKAAEVKTETKAAAEKATTAAKSTTAKVATATKKTAAKATTAAKKTAAKATTAAKKTVAKATAAKKEVKTEVYIQQYGMETTVADLVEKARNAYIAEGGKAASIKEVKVYVKPEEGAAYYVINGKAAGQVALF